jgi:hypothetical protein
MRQESSPTSKRAASELSADPAPRRGESPGTRDRTIGFVLTIIPGPGHRKSERLSCESAEVGTDRCQNARKGPTSLSRSARSQPPSRQRQRPRGGLALPGSRFSSLRGWPARRPRDVALVSPGSEPGSWRSISEPVRNLVGWALSLAIRRLRPGRRSAPALVARRICNYSSGTAVAASHQGRPSHRVGRRGCLQRKREARQTPRGREVRWRRSHHCQADIVGVWELRMPGTVATAPIACW